LKASRPLWNRLEALAAHPTFPGQILWLDEIPEVLQAYKDWDDEPTSIERANAVVMHIQKAIAHRLEALPEVEYLVLVGDDWIIPARRLPDRTNYPEGRYQWLPGTSRLGAALASNYFLSDDFYASRSERPTEETDLYLPELAVGRLVETPSEIIGQIDAFLANSRALVDHGLVTGYDFMTDGARSIGGALSSAGISVDGTLIGETWCVADLQARLAAGRYPLLALNQHATHWAMGVPAEETRWTTYDLAEASLAQTLVNSLGCHSGLNVPDIEVEEESNSLDWPQAFAQGRAWVIAPTGYSWGLRDGIGYSELLGRYFAQALTYPGTTVGQALMQAKQRYRGWARTMDSYDAKVLGEMALYGLPMMQFQTPLATPSFIKPSVSVGPLVQLTAGLSRQTYIFRPSLTITSTDGTHWFAYSLDPVDGVQVTAGTPLQPKEVLGLSEHVHGVVWVEGTYSDVVPFTPLMAHPVTQDAKDIHSGYMSTGWSPPRLQTLNRGMVAGSSPLVVMEGQYLAAEERERLYSELIFDAYLSLSEDWEPPRIGRVASIRGDGMVTVTVDVSDAWKVLVTYTDGQGLWRSTELALDEETGLWVGCITVEVPIDYVVQAVDDAGNVAWDDNGGLYYTSMGKREAAGLHCGGVGPLDSCGCLWGTVTLDGEPVYGAEVTIAWAGASITTTTYYHSHNGEPVEPYPYYSPLEPLPVEPGTPLTVSASYNGYRALPVQVEAPSPSQEKRLDLPLELSPSHWLFLPLIFKDA